jgi:murein DD-endopeptidase MepM/ murein hydrolase activator NlpD
MKNTSSSKGNEGRSGGYIGGVVMLWKFCSTRGVARQALVIALVAISSFSCGCATIAPQVQRQETAVTPVISSTSVPLQLDTVAAVQEPGTASPIPSQVGVPEKFLVHFPWPKGEGRILTTGFHEENALDFNSFAPGKAAVTAAANGSVLLADFSKPDSFNTYEKRSDSKTIKDMGNFVILRHGPDIYTVYMHLMHEDPAPVISGQEIPAGTRIGWEGNTGRSNAAHLHFAVVDVQIFPSPALLEKPLTSWGFAELNGSNTLILNKKYISQNGAGVPAQ